MNQSFPKRRGLKWLILGCVLCLLGTPVVAVLSLWPVIESSRLVETKRFLAPAEVDFSLQSVDKPIKYYLWNEFSTSYEGQVYQSSEELPQGLRVRIFDHQGEELNFTLDESLSQEFNRSNAKSIGYVLIEQPVDGRILVQGSEGMAERVMVFAPSVFRHAQTIILSVILTVLMILLGGAFAIRGFKLMGMTSHEA